jgi:hypothetical protein
VTFDEILEQVIVLFQRQKRVAYGALKRRFDLDDAYLEDLLSAGSTEALTLPTCATLGRCWRRWHKV